MTAVTAARAAVSPSGNNAPATAAVPTAMAQPAARLMPVGVRSRPPEDVGEDRVAVNALHEAATERPPAATSITTAADRCDQCS